MQIHTHTLRVITIGSTIKEKKPPNPQLNRAELALFLIKIVKLFRLFFEKMFTHKCKHLRARARGVRKLYRGAEGLSPFTAMLFFAAFSTKSFVGKEDGNLKSCRKRDAPPPPPRGYF